MKVLLDESVPRRLASAFPESFGTRTVQQMGWAGCSNGELLRLAADPVNGVRTEPSPGLAGTCAYCGRAMIPKCGRYVHRPPMSHAHLRYGTKAQASHRNRSAREPNRRPRNRSLHQAPASPPARPLLKRDGAPHGGLQASVLVEDPDIPLQDGLFDPRNVAARPLRPFRRVGDPAPQLASTVLTRLDSCHVRTTATTSILRPRSQSAFQSSRCAAPQERSAVAVSWPGSA